MRNMVTILAIVGAFVIGLVFCGQSTAKIDPKTAFLVWLCDEGSGDTVKDYSGNGNDGVFVNDVKWVQGKTGKGLKFNGTNTRVVSSTANGVGKTAFTECLWVRFDDFTTENQFGYIVSQGTANPRYFYFSTWSSAGGLHNCIHAGTLDTAGNWGRGISTGRLFDTDTWYFVCAVIDTKAGAINVYVDGELKQSQGIATGDTPGTPTAIWVGGTPENYQWANGTLDDIAFFNVALSQEDIQSIMKNGISSALGLTAVKPSGKLPVTWAYIKAQ